MNELDMKSFYDTTLDILKSDKRFIAEDGTFLRNAVYEAAMQMDKELIKLLLSHEGTAKRFFVDVDGVKVFDKMGFGWMINNRQFLPDSYTRFKNKIGLADENGEMISSTGKVELVFPFKDCVLEGGQTKEDQQRQEIFYNETLAPDEIDRLLYPKVLTGAKRYTKEGVQENITFRDDDNLIIKGNNLLALSSLMKRYEGKVKCIIIDPPYYFRKRKDGDTFKYNTNFRLSTWLVFMANRLSLAKKLLAKDGIILCNIKEDGFHWLKVLMEEIFGKDNFVETFIWKNTDNPDSLSKKSRSSVEYIICFEKKIDLSRAYIGKDTENGDQPLLNKGNKSHELCFPAGSIKFNIADGTYYPSCPDRVEIINPIIVSNGVNQEEVCLKGEFKWTQEFLDNEIANGTYFLVKTRDFSIRFQRPVGTTMAPEKFIDDVYLSKTIGVGTNEDASTHLKKLGINFNNSKPESLVAFFLRAMTEEGDLVLDFFLGSGTTCAVAHKMKRRYIGIEQMDYIKTETLKRLQKVLEGEQGGISISMNWQGGGSFVYCELAKLNQAMVEEIEKARGEDALKEIYRKMIKSGYISYKVDLDIISEAAKEYDDLSLEDKKRFLTEILDKNMLYVNYCDIDDEEFGVTEADKEFTKSFYGEA